MENLENLINQILNDKISEFTVTTESCRSETYVFKGDHWELVGNCEHVKYPPRVIVAFINAFYSKEKTLFEITTIRDACEKEIKFLKSQAWELKKMYVSIADEDERMSRVLGKRIKELHEEIASYEIKILEAEGKEKFTEAEIVSLFGYTDFFFLIDEAYIVRNVDMKWKVRQSV